MPRTATTNPKPDPGLKRIQELNAELRRKLLDPLRLYRPSLMQYAFHVGRARQRILRGGNRAGKSVAGAMEFAAAARRKPLLGTDGKPMPNRYPTNRRLILWVIGVDQKHISQTIHRLLFEKGGAGIKAIWDDAAGDYRIFNPNEDAALEAQAEQLEPLIPEHEIEEMVWEGAAERLFTACRLKNGSVIYAYASTGNIKQGDAVDVLWIDEDIENPAYVNDWRMRIVTTKGQFYWTAFPWSKNDALVKLNDIAEKEKGKPEPAVEVFEVWTSNNKFVDKAVLAEAMAGMSDEEIAARDRGQFSFGNRLVYNEYHDAVHSVPQTYEAKERADPLTALLEARGGLPDDWTRYMAIDPGTVQAAALFVAVPPPDWCEDERYHDIVVCEAELYPKRKTAREFARAIKQVMGGRNYRAILIDSHAARQTPLNVGKTIRQFFVEAFEEFNVRSEIAGAYPLPGCDDPVARREIVHSWLAKRDHGKPKLFVLRNHCPNLRMEFGLYQQRIVGTMTKEEVVDANNHLMACLEMLAANGCLYVPPERTPEKNKKSYDLLEWMQEVNKPRSSFINLGPRQGALV